MFVISQIGYEVLDESYFTNFLRWFMVGIDHTPYQLNGLSVIVSPFVFLFGDNSFAWRFPIIIFGMIFLYFNYKVIHHISNKKIALFTSWILSFSPLIFTHSSLMLRDIPVMALGFMALYFYFKKKFYVSFFIIGLSALIKETAMLFLVFIALHYILNNHKSITEFVLSKKIPKTFFFAFGILICSFLIPLYIYDNTITVLEYSTKYPEYLYVDENNVTKASMFEIKKTNSDLLNMPASSFNYLDKVKNPFHHISLMFSKGYYDQNNQASNSFLASFLPIENNYNIGIPIKGTDQTFTDSQGYTKHLIQFPSFWIQSSINYSYWHIAFYSSILLIGFAFFYRLKNNVELSKESKIISCAIISFFIPFLIIQFFRDSYSYYLIYYLPFMVFGLVVAFYKIPNKKLKQVVVLGFIIGILSYFWYMFPITLF